MKRKLLFAMLCIVSVLGLRAQSWTAPVIGSDPTSGTSYKLMNVEAGQFLVGAKVWYSWSTSTGLTGNSSGALSLTATTSGTGWTLTRSDGKGVFISGAYNGKGEMHVDGGTPTVVEFIKQANGFYRIRAVESDANYGSSMDGYETKYWGWEGYLSRPTNAVYATIVPNGNNCDWAFLSTADEASLNVYNARVALYKSLISAKAEGASTDDASAIYNNSESTVDQLTAAKTALDNVRFTHALDVASNSDPRDITDFILKNPDFSTGNITGWETNYVSGTQATNIGYQDNNNYVNGDYYLERFIEAWRSGNAKIGDGYLSQTVSDMPEGKYVLECDAIATNQASPSTTTTGALLYINADGVDFTTSLSTNGGTPLHFSTEFLFTGEGDVIFGLKTQSTTANWIAADNFKVTFYGIDLSAYETQLASAVAAFEALEGTVPSTTYTNKKTTIVDVNNKAWSSSKEYSTAIAAIQAATSELSALAPGYSEYQAVRSSALAAYASTDVTAADAAANSATTSNDLTTAITTVRAALLSAIKDNSLENIDLTSAFLTNSSFETGDMTGWDNTGMGVQGNNSFGKVGDYYAECWVPNGTKSIAQTLSGMTAGVYRVTATIKARGVTSADLSAGGVSKAMTISDEQNLYTVEFACDDDAEFTIKFQGVGTGAANSWLCADNFTLTYVGPLPELEAISGKMNAEVATAQTTAINTYNTTKTVANYNAASAAIAAAETSKAAYAIAATAIADANALKDAHNFASSTAISTFAEAIAAVQTKYDNGTLTNEEGNAGGSLGTIATGWHAGNNTPAAVYMRDGFALGDFAADPALHVNTWSIEGATDGSNFSVPFYESWTGDANSLPESTVTGTLAVENGLYTVSALVRVRAKTDVTATDATGITMDINGGGEGEYIAQDVTEGTQVGESQFTIATYTAKGLVKDGNLTLNFNIADGANISWLAFKNVKYTKVRDLTTEEAAVVPADLAIDATSTVFKGKTTTLTATSTTEGASIDGFVNWTSDNTSVATVDAYGVVTGVAYGTANITATSTLNASATATCAVTVTAPTYDQLENLDFAEGPVKDNMITTYEKDMTSNSTTYSQMQEVSDWSFGVANGDARAAGVMAYGSSYGLGANANTFYAPATNPAGEATGNALGMVGVWSGSVQYVQNVKFLAGVYTITVPVYRNSKNATVTALSKNLIGVILDDGTEHLATTTTYTQNAWTTEVIKFTVTEETYGKLSLGLNAPNAGSDNCQRLWIDGVTIAFEPFATAEEIADLNAAIETAEGKTLGFDEGNYAPYKNVDGVTALAAAKALDTKNPIAQSDVTSATTALTSATWTANTEEVNAVYDGTFAAATNNGAPAGWTMSNSTLGGATHSRAFVGDTRLSEFNTTNSALFIRFDGTYSDRGSLYYYGNANGYTMPLKAGVTYYAKADIKGWGSTGKNQRMNITGPAGFSTVSQDLTLSNNADTDDAEPQQFLIVFEATVDGNYVISFQTPGGDDQKHNAVISNVEVFRANAATMKISDAQYATFVAPFDVTIPADVTAYTIDDAEGNTLTMTEVSTTIKANTPVVLFKKSALDATTFYGMPVAGEPTEGLLTGVYTETVATAGTYVLQKNDGLVGFYEVAAGEEPTVGANRAYLTAPTTGVKAFFFGDVTAIKNVFDGVAAGNIYDLNGRKVSKMQKGGVYVVNGKKVLVK